ncbi:hypothetical protein ACLOJK_015156 [Asimina triloba]
MGFNPSALVVGGSCSWADMMGAAGLARKRRGRNGVIAGSDGFGHCWSSDGEMGFNPFGSAAGG